MYHHLRAGAGVGMGAGAGVGGVTSGVAWHGSRAQCNVVSMVRRGVVSGASIVRCCGVGRGGEHVSSTQRVLNYPPSSVDMKHNTSKASVH